MVLVLLVGNGVVALDRRPKSLPFHETRFGTVIDYFRKTGASYDWLFIGNSMCVTGVIPAVIEERMGSGGRPVRAFNVGFNGAGMAEIGLAFDKFFVPYCTQRVFVLVSRFQMTRGREPAVWESPGMRYEMGELPVVERALMMTPLFRYRRQLRA